MSISKVTCFVLATIACSGIAAAQDPTGALKKIKSASTISLGYRDSVPPFSFTDEKGEVHGYSLDLCYRIADALKAQLGLANLKVNLMQVTAANRIRLVQAGTVDLECGATTNTLAREDEVAFTITHFVAGNRFASKKSFGIQVFDDLKGLTVVSISGTTNIKQVVDLNTDRGLEMEILPAANPGSAFNWLETGRAAAFFWDDVLLAGVVANAKNPKQYVISDEALSVEPYAIMLRKNDPSFKDAVDNALIALFRSGEVEEIYAKWFLSPIPPHGITLNVPISPVLKRVFQQPISSGDPAAYR